MNAQVTSNRKAERSVSEAERRRIEKQTLLAMRQQLNTDQLITLNDLERFGWELKFIRRKPFQPLVPVVFDGDRKRFAIIKEDGTLDENPDIKIR